MARVVCVGEESLELVGDPGAAFSSLSVSRRFSATRKSIGSLKDISPNNVKGSLELTQDK